MKSSYGKCALCGCDGKLSFEHIPPKAAFNKTPSKTVDIFTILGSERNGYPWELDGMKYDNQQKGTGRYSLCQKCNELTGTWYGDSYRDFVYKAVGFLIELEKGSEKPKYVKFLEIRPLNFIKQVLSMFCSVNKDNSNIDDLRKFVLNKELSGIDKNKYRVCMYLTKSATRRMNSFFVRAIIPSGGIVCVSEIISCPFGFILYINPDESELFDGVDITSMADYKYDETIDIVMPVVVYDVNNWLPLDYRTKEQIINDINETKKVDLT